MTLVLSHIPKDLSDKLVNEYLEIKKQYSMNEWGPGQLKGGRLAEAVLRIFQHLLGRPITDFGTDIPAAEKTKILNTLQSDPSVDDHVRQKIVPLVRLLLDFRNNRDSAHLGGFDANAMDTLFVMTAATWILCELIRVYGGYTMPDAQKIVDGFAVKEYPVIMEVDGEAFVTRHGLTAKQATLVLLSKYPRADFEFLFSKAGDSNKTRYATKLDEMVKEKLIGFKDGEYFLMPRGTELVVSQSLLAYK